MDPLTAATCSPIIFFAGQRDGNASDVAAAEIQRLRPQLHRMNQRPTLWEHPEAGLDATEQFEFIAALKAHHDSMCRIDRPSVIFVPTFSSYVLNGVGHAVSCGAIPAGFATVILVQNGEPIQRAHYDQDGRLVNWQFGFLDPRTA